jgi:hypothetical protein
VLDGRRVSPRRGKGRLTEEAGKVRGRIAEGTPDRRGRPFALWTSRAEREPVARRLAERLGLPTVRPCLRRRGLTPRKPLVRAKERQPAAVAAWLERGCPAVARRAAAERAVTYRGDETGVSDRDQAGRSYAPRGGTLVVSRTARRVTRSMTAAAGNRGLVRFMLHDGALDVERFLAFLRRPAKDAGRQVFLTVGNLRAHRARKVEAWVASHAHEIELLHLPAWT